MTDTFWKVAARPFLGGAAAAVLLGIVMLVILPIPAFWFVRWIPVAWILGVGHFGNTWGPGLCGAALVLGHQWRAERTPTVRHHRPPVPANRGWTLGVAGLVFVGIVLVQHVPRRPPTPVVAGYAVRTPHASTAR